MTQVAYISACMDNSGYAEAARNHIAALHTVGVRVYVKPISFENYKSDLGSLGSLVHTLINKQVNPKIRILHATPQNYPRLIEKGKYSIGYAAWETDRLPNHWVDYINNLNEIWVPSNHNVEMMKRSGISIPIYCFPHPFNYKYHETFSTDTIISNKDSDEFVFYSIFQWLERKNPRALLKAYLTEFTPEEKVVLIIKTFLTNPGNPQEIDGIKKTIKEVKTRLFLRKYPKILLVSSLLSREQVLSLHNECDCYVCLSRCEGFGIPLVEAMLAKNPVIATTYGGPEDFIKGSLDNKPNEVTGYPVSYTMTPVYGMPWELYTGNMNWAEPDISVAKKQMRDVFERKKLAKKVGQQGYDFIRNNLSWERIGAMMKTRLEQIEKDL